MPVKRRLQRNGQCTSISAQQLAAAGSPGQSIRDLIRDQSHTGASNGIAEGNFRDLDTLLDQLAEPVIIELGKPLPNSRHLPGKRAGSCPAAHNRALLGDELH